MSSQPPPLPEDPPKTLVELVSDPPAVSLGNGLFLGRHRVREGALPTGAEIREALEAFYVRGTLNQEEFLALGLQCIRSGLREEFEELRRPYIEAKQASDDVAVERWLSSPAALEARVELECHTQDTHLVERLMREAARNGAIEWPGGHYNSGRVSAQVAWRWHVAWSAGRVDAEIRDEIKRQAEDETPEL